MDDDLLLYSTIIDWQYQGEMLLLEDSLSMDQARVIAMQPINSIFCLWYRRRREGFIFWVLVFAFF